MHCISKSAKPLPLENVYGHTKKVRLSLDVIGKLHRNRPDQPLKILDIGCGSGYAVTQFLARYGDEVLGIDFYPPNVDYANKHFGSAKLNFFCLDATMLRDEGKRYDVVVLTDVLEHVHQPGELLRLVHELVTDDGRVIASIPNGFGPFEIESYVHKFPLIGRVLDRSFAAAVAVFNRWIIKGRWTALLNREPPDLPYNAGSPHVQWFTESRFRDLVGKCGFGIEDFQKLSTFSGPFSNYLFGPFVRACEMNTALADRLPSAFASAWWMELSKARPRERTPTGNLT